MTTVNRLLLLIALGTFVGCTEQTVPTFSEAFPITVPSAANSLGPRLATNNDGKMLLSWMERAEKGATLRFAELGRDDWENPKSVLTEPLMFVNWADRPIVIPTNGDTLLAQWLRYSANETYSYDILTSRSSDNGESWSEPLSPHDDGTPTEHGFVSHYRVANGTGLIWLDGRKTGGEETDNPADTAMTLRTTTLTSDGRLSATAVIDDAVCDCCQTDVAVTTKGPIAVYRDRSESEVRDIYVAAFRDGQWQPGVAISNDNWIIAGCPVNGPAIDALGDTVAVVWYTAANGKPVVKTAVSTNAGRTFGEPIIIAGKKALGNVGLTMISPETYAVSWMEADADKSYLLQIRAVTTDGQLGPNFKVGRSSLAKSIPELSRVDDTLIMAWTTMLMDKSKIVSVRIPVLDYYDL